MGLLVENDLGFVAANHLVSGDYGLSDRSFAVPRQSIELNRGETQKSPHRSTCDGGSFGLASVAQKEMRNPAFTPSELAPKSRSTGLLEAEAGWSSR